MRGKLVGALPRVRCGDGVGPALVPGAISPRCQQQCFQGSSVQFRIRCPEQDRVPVIALIGQHLPDTLATRQAGCHNRLLTA